jgi:hypothetical protein
MTQFYIFGEQNMMFLYIKAFSWKNLGKEQKHCQDKQHLFSETNP